MIQESYCSYEVAKLLKEKGFDEPCRYFYKFDSKERYYGTELTNSLVGDKIYNTCTHQMACAWLREKGIHISPKYCCFQGPKKSDKPYYLWEDRVLKLPPGEQIHPDILGIHEHYSSYEEAVEAALKFCLENLNKLV